MGLSDILYDNGLLNPTNMMTPAVTGHGDTLYTASGGMITVMKIRGAIRHFSGNERVERLEQVEASLSSWNKQRGVYVSFIHESDPARIQEELSGHHAP